MNGIGVTGYIEDMESKPNGNYYVFGWKEDYLKLKQYRLVSIQIILCRNQAGSAR